jgi:ATP-dependent DNA helicase RecQ
MSGRYPRFNDILAVYASLSQLDAHERAVSLQQVLDDVAGVARSKVRVVLALFKDWGVVKQRRQQHYEVTRSGLVETDLEEMAKKYEARQARDREKLDRMIEYAQTAMCRWKKLVDYFGEVVDWERCEGCDSCSKDQEGKAGQSAAMRMPA